MEKAKTHLGNVQLHKNKSVMVEGGKVPRARVMDQTMIDRYLMRGVLNLQQHRAGEYLLLQAARGQAWPTGVDWSSVGSTGGKKDYVPSGGFAFGGTLACVEDKYGFLHAYVVKTVVLHDWDVEGDGLLMGCLKRGLDWVAVRRMGGAGGPLAALKGKLRG